jgi:hypothetical protein
MWASVSLNIGLFLLVRNGVKSWASSASRVVREHEMAISSPPEEKNIW